MEPALHRLLIAILTVIAIVITIMVICVFLIPFAIWRAFVIYKTWAWLIVPVWGVRALTMGQCYALSLFVSILWPTRLADDDDEEGNKTWTRLKRRIIVGIATDLFALGAAWIVKSYFL